MALKLRNLLKNRQRYELTIVILMPMSTFRLLLYKKSWVGKHGEYVIMHQTSNGSLTTKREGGFMPMQLVFDQINEGAHMVITDKHYAVTPHTIDVSYSTTTEKCSILVKTKKKQVHAKCWEKPPTAPKEMPK